MPLRSHFKDDRLYEDPIQQVVNVLELCEAVLLHLPLIDLLRVQSVCRSMRAVVQTSPAIQIKLFLKHDPNIKETYWWYDKIHHTVTGGPDTSAVLDKVNAAGPHKNGEAEVCRPCIYNPLLIRGSDLSEGSGLNYRASRAYYNGESVDILDVMMKITPHSSCRAMLLSQPPMKSVRISLAGKDNSKDSFYLVCNDAGVTCGEAYDAASQ